MGSRNFMGLLIRFEFRFRDPIQIVLGGSLWPGEWQRPQAITGGKKYKINVQYQPRL